MNARTALIGATALALALGLTACGSGDDGKNADGSTTLKLVAADYGDSKSNASGRYWAGVVRDFERKHKDITVDVQVVNWNDIDKTVRTMVQSGNVPDLVQTGGYADKVADDLLHEADEVLSPRTLKNLDPTLAAAGEVDGTQYGIPWTSSTRMLFYNKEVFRKAGVKTPPKTWDEVAGAARKIKSSGAAETPYALPLGPEEAQGESLLWEMGNGGGFTTKNGRYTLNSSRNAATFRWLRSNLVKPGLTYAHPAGTDRKTAFADFAGGKAGMVNGHTGLVQMAEKGDVDYGVTAIPGKDGALKHTLGVADWMMAFKDGGKQEQIKKFLDFTYAEKTREFAETYDFLPVTRDAFREMKEDEENRSLRPFFDQLPGAKFYPLGDPVWDSVSAEIKKTGGKAVQEDPAKILGDLQKKAEEAASRR